jgi:signal peptidase I
MDEIGMQTRSSGRRWRAGVAIIKMATLVLCIVMLVRYFLAQPFIVSGASMEPAFMPGEYLAIDRLTYRFHEPRRGDVVVFRYPLDPSLYFIKRIVGLPGETVLIDHDAITVFDERQAVVWSHAAGTAPIVEADTPDGEYHTTLAGDEYFVLGDNYDQSDDSRKWGPLQKEFLIGRPMLRLWPLGALAWHPGAQAGADTQKATP